MRHAFESSERIVTVPSGTMASAVRSEGSQALEELMDVTARIHAVHEKLLGASEGEKVAVLQGAASLREQYLVRSSSLSAGRSIRVAPNVLGAFRSEECSRQHDL